MNTVTVADLDPDAWYDGEQFAAAIGVKWSTLRHYIDTGLPRRNPIPKTGRDTRISQARRREWRGRFIIDWQARRPGKGGRPPVEK